MKACIFEIKHFAVHDGPGIRTTVFFKGCPLKCLWCHNPESLSPKPQLGFFAHRCTLCGECISVCAQDAQRIDANGKRFVDRSKCIACSDCVEVCFPKALTLYGKTQELDSIVEELLADRDFYSSSGGGITLSGGECLLQADFCARLLSKMKQNGIHTAVDTCGYIPQSSIDKVIPYTDLFLYDLKAFDEDVHKRCTGVSNKLILDNLSYICKKECAVEVRIPFVPEYNADQIENIARFIAPLKTITCVRILPYHNFAKSKYRAVDMEDTLPKLLPNDKELDFAKNLIRSFGIKVAD